MTWVVNDLTGQAFGRLLVVVRAPNKSRKAYWWCICECGSTVCVRGSHLTVGQVQSCGCLKAEQSRVRNRSHGHSAGYEITPTYRSWRSMRSRCEYPYMNGYENYGGRGVTVCERWSAFENFLADMGERPPGTTLDRKDNDGDYEPGNCRWATPKEQATNRRKRRVMA